MRILSIDVGIKNMSFCLFETLLTVEEANSIKILKWDNIDLTETENHKCIEIDNNGLCDKPAKFSKNGNCYCLKHSKKHNYLQPTQDLKPSYLNKQKIQSLIDIADKYKIKYDNPPKKAVLIGLLTDFMNSYCYTAIEKTNATKIDLVTICKNIHHKFDEILCNYLNTIDTIIIENQIGPIANKMKTIQGMISQYFIMKNNNIQIEFISATNKLKDFLPKDNKDNKDNKNNTKKIDYKQRKKLGIQTCLEMVSTDFRFKEWETFFAKHTKKDDLSDCFLQGMWYIKHKM
jgi:hypothetical protein